MNLMLGHSSPNHTRMLNLQHKFDQMQDTTHLEHQHIRQQFNARLGEFCLEVERDQEAKRQHYDDFDRCIEHHEEEVKRMAQHHKSVLNKTTEAVADIRKEQETVFQEMVQEGRHNIQQMEVRLEKEHDRLATRFKMSSGLLEKQRKDHVTDLVFQIHLMKGSMEKYQQLKKEQLESFSGGLQSQLDEIQGAIRQEQKTRENNQAKIAQMISDQADKWHAHLHQERTDRQETSNQMMTALDTCFKNLEQNMFALYKSE